MCSMRMLQGIFMRSGLAILITSFAMSSALVAVCEAHPAQLVAANASIHDDGRVRVVARFDLLAFALNDTPASVGDAAMNALLDGPSDVLNIRLIDARERFGRGVRILCGQRADVVRGEVTAFATVDDVHRLRDSGILPRLPLIQEVTLDAQLPEATTSVSFRFPEVMGPVVLTVERPGAEPYSEPLEAGTASSMLPIRLHAATAQTAVASVPDPGSTAAMGPYLMLGFTHILPHGPDHILFVLGLFLLSTRWRPLLWQVTAFTLAHSITLALALYGVVRLPPIVVEPLIAASIAFVAVENLITTDLKPWRPAVVFVFGLVHGLGFAGVLAEMGLPRRQFVPALLTFNVGIELGQLSVIALAFVLVGWWRSSPWYRRAIVLPASFAIAAIAVVWTIQRVINGA